MFDSVRDMEWAAAERATSGSKAATARQLAHQHRPVVLARDQVLPVHPALAPLLPEAVLRRGSTIVTSGTVGRSGAATSLALALAAAPSAAGSWVGVVGLPSLGLLAAAQAGVALERLILVASPDDARWPTVVAT